MKIQRNMQQIKECSKTNKQTNKIHKTPEQTKRKWKVYLKKNSEYGSKDDSKPKQ